MWLSELLVALLRLLLGITARWQSPPQLGRQRIYFANHSSHMDTLAIISALPKAARRHTRPVAAADYWGKNAFLRFISGQGLRAVLIERHGPPGRDALAPVVEALAQGDSIILFPEGTRGDQPLPAPFKSGLFRLHQQFPDVELVPVYLQNFHRSLPKGKRVPLPILCNIRIGDPIPALPGEDKAVFLERAREAVVRLAQ
ncbi:lysophospholipid acyltransferase family protein [Pseudomonas sp. KNUC1026]|uniref:lysophospholipid acyltransferase family protein n=1 Tax=Pseudomonas sp. KNUC1026 TaxID=2893890 RepID=UPI001F2A45C0|nr:lysophospholipid acyltransferase family protein [Pseudomonas sp. KNUC1026]UFH49280.1 1-acyl-sn-glycerol-3-phosphate acyltransferase [Pseudomonas sp. KNUC1026]